MTEPTDAEIRELWEGYNPMHGIESFARAVLAKWGTLRAEKIVIPTDTMEQEFQKYYRRGYEAGKKAATPQPAQVQPVVREPLTDGQIAEMMRETWGCASIAPRYAMGFARAIERAHGITGGQHGD